MAARMTLAVSTVRVLSKRCATSRCPQQRGITSAGSAITGGLGSGLRAPAPCHTRHVRWAPILAVLLAAAPARADDHDTWADILDPHGAEIRQIIEKAGQAQMQAANFVNYD